MGKKYPFADVSAPTLPRITSGRFVHGFDYTHKCVGRGSMGYGYSARQAYERWKKNWTRRHAFYKGQHDQAENDQAENVLALFDRVKTPPKRESVYGPPVTCKFCQASDLYWQIVRGEPVLSHRDDLRKHECNPTAEGFTDV